jgi:Carboxypeptidase regulatory-like domain
VSYRQISSAALLWAIFWIGILPSLALEPTVTGNVSVKKEVVQAAKSQFIPFPCGLSLGNRQLLPSMMVLGKEDGEKALDFSNWSIPFNVLTQTLKFKTKTLADGSIELRSSAAVVIINPQQLSSYPEIGLAIKIKDLEKYLGIKAEFDLIEYTIKLTLPQAFAEEQDGGTTENSLSFEGLEVKKPQTISLTAIEQKNNFSGSNNSSQSQRQTRATGSILGANWYAQIGGNSDDLLDLSLNDFQIVKYSDNSDYIFGGQSAFWNRQNSGDYWGATGIWRQGFTPQLSNTGSINSSERTQANKVGRSIVGSARPGTLVRLLPVASNRTVAEVLVDSSGVFRFDNIPVANSDRYYRLWLFANGQLSVAPEVREVNFVTVPGQLPTGATATLASIGLRRETGGLIGNFSDVRGAVVRHWGVTEWLTLGTGVSLDQGVQGLGELYFQPNGVPLEAAISVRTGAEWDVLSNVNWQPDTNLKFAWNLDRISQRVQGDWQLSPQLSLNSNYNSSEALGIGFNYQSRSESGTWASLNASIDANAKVRWRGTQQLGAWELQNQGNDAGTLSNLTYSFDRQREKGSSIQLTYQTSQLSKSSEFATLAWRYRQTEQSPWEIELGYGLGNEGSGFIASGAVNVLPGLNLRGRYQTGINSNSPSFSLEIFSSLETQNGLRENPQQLDQLRTHGGIEIVPFFDLNSNGQRDPGEKSYLDLELININQRPIQPFRPQIVDDRIAVRVAPGRYRLDFDPAGFPSNWRTQAAGYAVEVAAGSYTKVLVPLLPSYSIEGAVKDSKGRVMVGAKVDLVPLTTGERSFSITSRDGQFYLESLSQGNYQIQIDGRLITTINLNATSPSSQTINLQL